jgi:hypothetical protein
MKLLPAGGQEFEYIRKKDALYADNAAVIYEIAYRMGE